VSKRNGAKVGKKVAVSSISSEVRGKCVLCSAKVGKVMSVIGRGRVNVDKVSASVSKVSPEVGKVRYLGDENKVAESDVSGATLDQEVLCYASDSVEMHKFESIRGLLGIASGSCPKVGVDIHKFGHVEVVGLMKSTGTVYVSELFDDADSDSEYFGSESESGAKVGKSNVAVSYISRDKVGGSKEAVWMGSEAKVSVDVTPSLYVRVAQKWALVVRSLKMVELTVRFRP